MNVDEHAVGSGRGRLRPGAAGPPPRLITAAPSRYARFVKPCVDRIGAVVLLVLLAPLIVVTAVTILLTLGRPLLYRQPRVGRHGDVFEMLKFRTMHPDRRRGRDHYDGVERRHRHKTDADPRHTRLGRRLRRFSLDELPQLWNVVRGELSLVGPRPELVQVVERYEPWQHRRHMVRPGLTGLWQVTERDDNGEMHRHTATDLRYVDNLSPGLDLWILVMTVPAVLGLRVVPRGPAAPHRSRVSEAYSLAD